MSVIVKCPECDGKGKWNVPVHPPYSITNPISDEFFSSRPEPMIEIRLHVCPRCDGKGRVRVLLR